MARACKDRQLFPDPMPKWVGEWNRLIGRGVNRVISKCLGRAGRAVIVAVSDGLLEMRSVLRVFLLSVSRLRSDGEQEGDLSSVIMSE